jgi:hypothetical protein
MGVAFKNNAESTLDGGILIGATSLSVQAGHGTRFPSTATGDHFYCTLVDVSGNREIIKVTTRSGDNFTVIVRAADDSTAQAWADGDKVQLRLPKIILEGFRDDIATNASAITAIEAEIDVLDTYFAGTGNPGTVPAAAGTKMYFYQDTAPTNWTIDSGPADSLLAVKGGSEDYNTSGGATAGSWTPTTHTHTGPSHTHTGPSHTHTGPSHTHTGGSHALTEAEMPAHTHSLPTVVTNSGATVPLGTFTNLHGTSTVTGSTGSGNAHSHGATSASGTGATGASGTGATGASGTAATGASSSPSSDRPKAAVGIIATKD